MTPLISWEEDLVIGVPEIDAHHKALVALLNELHETVFRRRGVDACRDVVERLRSCALSHLEAEERLMHQAGHNAYGENLVEQRELIRQLDDMLTRMDGYASNITFQGLHQLKAWLLAHIRYVAPGRPQDLPAEDAAPKMFGLLLKRI